MVVAAGFCFLLPCCYLFLLLFLTVVVLLSMVAQGSSYGGNEGCQVVGEGFSHWRLQWRKNEREEKGSADSRNDWERLFFCQFRTQFSPPLT
jgi:hypothetical protein